MVTTKGTGVYIAYPRREKFRVAHTGPGTLVNCRHTKIGFATDSFHSSAANYRKVFNNQVKFIPLAEVAPQELSQLEKKVMSAMKKRFEQVGASHYWFNTQDRAAIIALVYGLLSPAANETEDYEASLEKTG